VRHLSRLAAAYAVIDAANADDPEVVSVRGETLPLALAHGRLATVWVERLIAEPTDVALIAARAHHLRRWVVPRTSYPEGRAAYLRWRKDQKARHAAEVADLLVAVGYDDAEIARVQQLIRRELLGRDADTGALEDAACLVFLETQLTSVAGRLDHDRLLAIIAKTAAKMTPAGLALVNEVPLSADAQMLLFEALR
jgi:hypothetical protein